MSRDQCPIVPSQFNLIVQGRRCAGTPNSIGYPLTYTATVYPGDLQTTDSTVPAYGSSLGGAMFSPGLGRVIKTFRDSAVALFDGGSDPTNKDAIDALAKRSAQDWMDWQTADLPGDVKIGGIVAPTPNGLIDVIEWSYRKEEAYTRIQSPPFNGTPDELAHYDPATARCTDANNSTNPNIPVGFTPQLDFYSPPESCVGGGGKATATVEDGKVVSVTITSGGTYTGTPDVCFSDDGVGRGATATATLTGTAITSIAVTAGGSGYSSTQPPVVSFNGGGTKLQKTRKRLYIEAGVFIPRFVAYETIQS